MSTNTVQALPLARKYRPRSFIELVGQKTVATALQKAIELSRIPQAILLTGVRGIGKTTTARLFAKSVVCETGPTVQPCGTCISCTSMDADKHPDVLEMDGASHTGVDDVRRIIESVHYNPQMSEFKVYVIDEVHMLSNSAFNALLKTLEEPPAKVVFVFATTELHKVPETIVSRCQLFRLEKFQTAEIVGRLKNILQQEEITFEDAALKDVAAAAGGSMRDALTLLDQVIAVGGGEVTLDGTTRVTGTASSDICVTLLQALLAKNAAQAIETVSTAIASGAKIPKICEQTLELCRHVFSIPHLGETSKESLKEEISPGHFQTLTELGAHNGSFDSNRLFRCLYRMHSQLVGDSLDRFLLENVIVEWCTDPGLPTFQNAAAGQAVATGAAKKVSGATAQPQPNRPQPNQAQATQEQPPAQTKPQASNQRNIMGEFQKTVGQKKKSEKCEKLESLRKIADGIRSEHPIIAKHLEYAQLKRLAEGAVEIRLPEGSIHAKAFAANPEWVSLVANSTDEFEIKFQLSLQEADVDAQTTLRSVLSDERQAAEAKRVQDRIESKGVLAATKTLGAEVVQVDLPSQKA